jgi:hypothetical protein
MQLDLDFIILLKLVKFIQSKTTVGVRNQNSIEIDIFPQLSPFNNDLFMSLEDMNHLLLILKDLILLITNNQLSGSLSKYGVAVLKLTLNTGLELVQFHNPISSFSEVKRMVPPAFHLISLILNKIKSQKQVVYQTKTLSIKELSFVKTIKFMLMDMKMTLHTFTTCRPKPGPKSEIYDFILKLI